MLEIFFLTLTSMISSINVVASLLPSQTHYLVRNEKAPFLKEGENVVKF